MTYGFATPAFRLGHLAFRVEVQKSILTFYLAEALVPGHISRLFVPLFFSWSHFSPAFIFCAPHLP